MIKDDREKAQRDHLARMNSARREGMMIPIVKNAKQMNFKIEDIAKITGLTIETVEELIRAY